MFKNMLLAAAMLAVPFATQAAELPAAIRAKGTLVVANVPNYPPMEMKDPATGKLVGFDIDLGDAIAKKLGVTIQWQETSFDQMIASLRTGRVDVVLSGMSDKPDRRGVADFVDYLRSGSQVFTQARRAPEFTSLESLCGRSVGASRRTNFVVVLKDWSDANCVAKGKPAINVVGTEGSADARTQLRQGRIDAAMQGGETLPYIMGQEANTYALVGEPLNFTLMGIATNKEVPAMQTAIADALKELVADGTYATLLKKWSLDASGIKEVTTNAGE